MADPNGKSRTKPKWWEVASAVVAICAFVLAIYSAAATRTHDRLSVLPKISFVWDSSSSKLSIENLGEGPAVIRNFSVSLDGNEVKDVADANAIDVAVSKTRGIFNDLSYVQTGVMLRTYFFAKGATLTLLSTASSNIHDSAGRTAFKNLIEGQLLIVIDYCSVYGQCWTECSKRKDPTCNSASPAEESFNRYWWDNLFSKLVG